MGFWALTAVPMRIMQPSKAIAPSAEEITKMGETSSFAKLKGGVLTQPAWKKQRLIALFDDGELAIDVKQGTITHSKSKAAAKLMEHARKHEVNVVAQLAKGALLQVKSGTEVQLYRPGKEVVVLATADRQTPLPITIIPSPDRKLMVIQNAFGQALKVAVMDVDGKKIIP